MKQVRSYLLMALLTLVGNAYADQLTVADFTINPGETYDLSVGLENPDYQYIMTEFWMSLPDGVSIATDSDDEFLYEVSDRFTSTHQLVISKESDDNVYHFLIYSSRNKPLKESTGELFKITLEAASDATTGVFQGRIYGQVFSDTNMEEHNPAEVTFNVSLGQETPKCATPTISYIGGKLKFACETEGVTFHYSITAPSFEDAVGNDIELSTTYTVSVYASKDGYEDSDAAEASVDMRGMKGDVNGDSRVDIADVTAVINIINQ